ncbi:hypothetical protein [Plantactinospora veratri]
MLAAWARWPLTTSAPAQAMAAPERTGAADSTAAAALDGTAGTATTTESGSGRPAGESGGGRPAGESGVDDAPTETIPTVTSPSSGAAVTVPGGGAATAPSWPGSTPTTWSPPSSGTTTPLPGSTATPPSSDTTATLSGGTAAAGGRTAGAPTEPSREQPPSPGNWSFDIGRGVPTPRTSPEDSAPTERFGSSTPAVPESGQRRGTEPGGPAGSGPSAASADAGLPAGWTGARRLRTEDFWPTTTPPVTPSGPAGATAPSAPAGTTPSAAPEPATTATPPTAAPPTTAPPTATFTPQSATSSRSDDAWDAFTPVSRPRLDGREPTTEPTTRPEPSGADPARTGRMTPVPVVAGDSPDQDGDAPAQVEGAPGQVEGAPGQAGDAPSQVRDAPGQVGGKPGQAGDAPGRAARDRGTPPTGSGPETTAEVESESVTEDAQRPAGRIRRGLFRRNRGGTDAEQTGAVETGKDDAKQDRGESKPGRGESKREAKGRNRTEEPVPARDEEYVDWVSGLSEPDPTADDIGLDRSVRRSLRSTGRHHAD